MVPEANEKQIANIHRREDILPDASSRSTWNQEQLHQQTETWLIYSVCARACVCVISPLLVSMKLGHTQVNISK